MAARKMFGEYRIYCGEKRGAMVADDQLFLKPTPGVRALALGCEEASQRFEMGSCYRYKSNRFYALGNGN